MKEYPSISRDIRNIAVYAFDKLDGSNIRAEWSRKNSFYKFGSRHRLLGDDDPFLGEAIELIQNKYAKDLDDVFRKQRYESAIAFFEFYGHNSFAGLHEDEPHTVTLLDVNPYKKGILYPNDFLKIYGHIEHAPLLYHGNANQIFVQSVVDKTLEGITSEGVVCKAPNGRTPMPVMFKVKTREWLDRLKQRCAGDEILFEKLE